MATLQTWVDRTRSHLMSGRSEERNVLASPYTAGSGAMQFTAAVGGIVPGARLSIGTSTYYVASVNQTAQTAQVIAAQEGTVDVNKSAGSLVRVNPRFTDADIVDALNAELSDLSAPDNGLFAVFSMDWDADVTVAAYPVTVVDPSVIIDCYEVRTCPDPNTQDWFLLPKTYWRLDRMAGPPGMEPDLQLRIAYPTVRTGGIVRALLRVRFIPLVDLTENLDDTGLPPTAQDIPPLGAAMRLMAGREVKRNFTETQGDTRRADEVPAGAVAASMRPLAALRMTRIQAEGARLTAQYPDRRV